MGFASAYDVWVDPLKRELPLFTLTLTGWIALQFGFAIALPKFVPNWHRLARTQQQDVVIRCCSIVNGAIMTFFACSFLLQLKRYNWHFADDFYAVLPYYRYGRISIMAYFAWDIMICFYYKWSLSWKVHAFASFIGSYILAFPFSENYCVYYTGCFEMSNIFLHTASILRTIAEVNSCVDAPLVGVERGGGAVPPSKDNDSRHDGESYGDASNSTVDQVSHSKDNTRVSGSNDSPPDVRCVLAQRLQVIADWSEYIFAFLFLVIRVVCSTYVTRRWLGAVGRVFISGVKQYIGTGVNNMVHDELAVVLCIIVVCTIQSLQYVWFFTIVKTAIHLMRGSTLKEKKA